MRCQSQLKLVVLSLSRPSSRRPEVGAVASVTLTLRGDGGGSVMFLIIAGSVCTPASGCWQSSLKRANNGVTFSLPANQDSGSFLSDNFFLQLLGEDTAVSAARARTTFRTTETLRLRANLLNSVNKRQDWFCNFVPFRTGPLKQTPLSRGCSSEVLLVFLLLAGTC